MNTAFFSPEDSRPSSRVLLWEQKRVLFSVRANSALSFTNDHRIYNSIEIMNHRFSFFETNCHRPFLLSSCLPAAGELIHTGMRTNGGKTFLRRQSKSHGVANASGQSLSLIKKNFANVCFKYQFPGTGLRPSIGGRKMVVQGCSDLHCASENSTIEPNCLSWMKGYRYIATDCETTDSFRLFTF